MPHLLLTHENLVALGSLSRVLLLAVGDEGLVLLLGARRCVALVSRGEDTLTLCKVHAHRLVMPA